MKYLKSLVDDLRTITPEGYVFFGMLFLLGFLLFLRIAGV